MGLDPCVSISDQLLSSESAVTMGYVKTKKLACKNTYIRDFKSKKIIVLTNCKNSMI